MLFLHTTEANSSFDSHIFGPRYNTAQYGKLYCIEYYNDGSRTRIKH